jgi:hypothetical protein
LPALTFEAKPLRIHPLPDGADSIQAVLKGTVTMQSIPCKSSSKAFFNKSLISSFIGLIICSNLALTSLRANNGDIVRRRPENDATINLVDDRLDEKFPV